MKTSILNLLKVKFIIALLFVFTTGFSQKSINYESVGTSLEEITVFFDNTCTKIEKASAALVSKTESLNKNDITVSKIEKPVELSEVQINELEEVDKETMLLLSNKNITDNKKPKHIGKHFTDKPRD